jgi:F-type H+-transporting ATPase subunit gamma
MTNPRELRRRIRTISNIERTVDAMQKISAARLSRERTAVLSSRPYVDALVGIVRDLAASREYSHPLFDVREDKGYLLLVIGSDRGMCGSYNTNVTRAATEFIATRHREKLYLVTAGRKVRRITPRTRATVIRETIRYPRPLAPAHVDEVAGLVTNAFLRKDAVRVYFAYTEYRSVSGSRPVIRRILPLMPPGAGARPRLFEPSAAAVLKRLLPLYVQSAVRQAFAEAEACEHAARMVMMEQASVNARRMIDELTLTANKLRQALITRELSDIVGTTEALA